MKTKSIVMWKAMTSVEGHKEIASEMAFNIKENSGTPTSTASQGATQTLFALQNMKSNKVDALEACFVIRIDGSAVSNVFKSLK